MSSDIHNNDHLPTRMYRNMHIRVKHWLKTTMSIVILCDKLLVVCNDAYKIPLLVFYWEYQLYYQNECN